MATPKYLGTFRRSGTTIWYFYYRGADGRKVARSTGQRNRRHADEVGRAFVEDLIGRPAAPTFREYTVTFFVWGTCGWIRRQLEKDKRFSQGTANMRRGHLRNYIWPAFGDTLLSDTGRLNAVAVENWLLSLPLANQSRNHVLRTMSIVLKEAKRQKIVRENPIADVEGLSVTATRRRDIYTTEDLQRLYPDDLDELLGIWNELKYAVMFLTILTSGARYGEACAWRWRHVSWRHGGISIAEAVKTNREIGPAKNQEARAVILPRVTMRALAFWRQQSLFAEPADFMFYGPDRGRLLSNTTLVDRLRFAMARAGVDTTGRNLDVHSARKTYNTRMRSALAALNDTLGDQILREMMGHRSQAMTELYDAPSTDDRRPIPPAGTDEAAGQRRVDGAAGWAATGNLTTARTNDSKSLTPRAGHATPFAFCQLSIPSMIDWKPGCWSLSKWTTRVSISIHPRRCSFAGTSVGG